MLITLATLGIGMLVGVSIGWLYAQNQCLQDKDHLMKYIVALNNSLIKEQDKKPDLDTSGT